jgi:hypothetical protein
MYGIALQKNWESIQEIVLPKNSYPCVPASIYYGYALRVYFLCIRFKDVLINSVNWETVERLPVAAQAMVEAQALWEIADAIGPDGTIWWKKILEDSRCVFQKFCKRFRHVLLHSGIDIPADKLFRKKTASLDIYFQSLSDLATVARRSLENPEVDVDPEEVEEIATLAKSLPLIYAEYVVNHNFATVQFRITRDKACRYAQKLINEICNNVKDHFEDRPEVMKLFYNDYRRKHRLKKAV